MAELPVAADGPHPAACGDSALREYVAQAAELGRRALEGRALDDLLADACALAGETLGLAATQIVEDVDVDFLLRAHWVASGRGIAVSRFPHDACPLALQALEAGGVVVAEEGAATALQPAAVSSIALPLRGSTRPFGVLCAHSARRRTFDEDETTFLELVANVLAAAVETQRHGQLFSALVEHGPDIVIRFDRELRHLYVSPGVTAVTGIPRASFIGRTNRELGMDADLCALWERELLPVFDRGEPHRFEFEFEGADGTRLLESHVVPERNAHGDVETIVSFTRDRTDARRAEQATTAGEARYRELFELASELTILFDSDGRIVDVNPAVERTLGYERRDLIGHSYHEIVSADEHDAAAERLAQKLADPGLATTYESVLIGKWGARLPVETSSRTIMRDGRPAGVLAVSRDISDHKSVVAALEESERRFRSAFDDAAVGMLLAEPDGVLIRVNAAFGRMLGLAPAELAGRRFEDIAHPDDAGATAELIARVLADEDKTALVERRFLHADGHVVWGHLGMSAVRGDDGSVRYFVTQVEDVTELRRVRQQLEESETLHRVVVESSRDLIVVLDLDGRIRLVSRSIESILGYGQRELIGRPCVELIAPEDVEHLTEIFARALDGAEAVRTRAHVLAQDGAVRLIEGQASAAFDADGKPTFIVANARDVTEENRLEEQLRQSQKMEAIGSLAGGIAHDFNNLLTAINGYSDLALGLLPAGESTLRHSLEQVRKAGDHAADLTRQLLAFSRRQLLQPEVVDLNAIVDEYLTMLERLVGEDVSLLAQLEPALPAVHADPGQLGQVLLNLVVNARDAMPSGGELRIATAAAEGPDGGTWATLSVSDTGHGIDAETQERIFEPFFTTKEHGKGTGLGLSTVHGIVEQSGGTISVESRLDHGTTFVVSLPPAPTSAQPDAEPERPETEASGGTILVVEDEDVVRGVLVLMLESLGYRVLAASSPGEALQVAAGDTSLDLVITDVVMPEMNGRELARRLEERRPGTRVLYTSGYTGDTVSAHGVFAAEDLLQKPFTSAALAARVRAALAD